MKFLIAFVALLAVAYAQHEGAVNVEEDNDGYKIKYDFTKAYRSEHHTKDGRVHGSYSYIDDIGLEHHVNFQVGPTNPVELRSLNTPSHLKNDDLSMETTKFYRRLDHLKETGGLYVAPLIH